VILLGLHNLLASLSLTFTSTLLGLHDLLASLFFPFTSTLLGLHDLTRWLDLAGPSHFLACGSLTGATELKHRHLRQLGYALVVVPYWEWDQVRGDEAAEVGYLRGKLDSSCGGEWAAAS